MENLWEKNYWKNHDLIRECKVWLFLFRISGVTRSYCNIVTILWFYYEISETPQAAHNPNNLILKHPPTPDQTKKQQTSQISLAEILHNFHGKITQKFPQKCHRKKLHKSCSVTAKLKNRHENMHKTSINRPHKLRPIIVKNSTGFSKNVKIASRRRKQI